MRDWSKEANRDRDVLTRIVALLVALADLADLASGLPAPRRRRLLEILIYGEAEALAFITGLAPAAPACAPIWAGGPEPTWNDTPEPACDAARLAASFRVLALVLWSMLAATRRLVLPGAADRRAAQHRLSAPALQRRPAALPAPDTS